MIQVEQINYTILVVGITISFSGLLMMLAVRSLNHWYKSFFVTIFMSILAYMTTKMTVHLSSGIPEMYYLTKAATYLSYIATSLPTLMFAFLIINTTSKSHVKGNRFTRLAIVLWNVYMVFLSATQFVRVFYYITPDNQFYKTSFYYLMLLPLFAILIIDIGGLIKRWKLLTTRRKRAFSIYCFVPPLAMLSRLIYPGIYSMAFGMSIVCLYMFIFVMEDYIDLHKDNVKTNADQKASILALQMRPHFIYNTLTSIYYLCDEDTEKAKSTILAFTSYMRKNFTALSSEDTVPFEDELAHTKAYLEVEKTRFEDEIEVEYDIKANDFKLPPLTLQPLAENAIKHGRKADGGTLNIVIRTRQTTKGIEVIVENTGASFGEIKNDDPHIALNNMRERLRMMCSGTLTVESVRANKTEESRTIATIVLPQRAFLNYSKEN